MNIFVDINYSFIRQPINLALLRAMPELTLVFNEKDAQLVIGTSDNLYYKPCIILSDNPSTFIISDSCLAISPVPTNSAEMETLIEKVRECLYV